MLTSFVIKFAIVIGDNPAYVDYFYARPHNASAAFEEKLIELRVPEELRLLSTYIPV